MHLVVGCQLALCPYLGEEVGIVVKGTSELMGVAFLNYITQRLIPVPCTVGVESVATTEPNPVEEGVLTNEFANVIEVAFPPVFVLVEIGFVIGGYGYDLHTVLLTIGNARLD